MKIKLSKKDTNDFEYAIFGIDLMLKYFFVSLKRKKKNKKRGSKLYCCMI